MQNFVFDLFSSASSIGTSLAYQGSHLNNAFFYNLPASLFTFSLYLGEPFPFLFFCGRASTSTVYSWAVSTTHLSTAHHSSSQLSTVQHSTAQSTLHKAAKHLRANQSATTQARTQSWREPAYRLS